jgi:hypothetical protein
MNGLLHVGRDEKIAEEFRKSGPLLRDGFQLILAHVKVSITVHSHDW